MSQAAQRIDAARPKVAEADFWRQHQSRQVEDLEKLQSQIEEGNRAALELDLHMTNKGLDFRTSEDHQLRTAESEALSQVQAEQAKLSELQDGLVRLDKNSREPE